VSNIELSAALFGRKQSLPVALTPVGLAGRNARRGEVQAARAAAAFGVPFALSTVGPVRSARWPRAVRRPSGSSST